MRDKIIALAKEAGIDPNWIRKVPELPDFLERFYKLAVAEDREKVAKWMMQHTYATGHGDTIEDFLNELEWQVREKEREECAKLVSDIGDDWDDAGDTYKVYACDYLEDAIRARKP